MLGSNKDLEAKLSANSSSSGDSQRKISDLERSLSDCKGKVPVLEAEISSLKSKLAAAGSAAAAAPVVAAKKEEKKEDTKKDNSEDAVLARIQAKAEKIDFGRIGSADGKDDLKLIKGIGPFIERKLNALGITTFAQISKFNEEDKDIVNEAIEFFPGRVKRDDWVGQAKDFLKG